MKGTITRLYTPDNPDQLPALCGPQHRNLMKLEMAFIDGKLEAESQGGSIRLSGSADAVANAEATLAAFEKMLKADPDAGEDAFEGAIEQARAPAESYGSLSGLRVPVMPQTNMQAKYIDYLTRPGTDLVFGTGPAGTGKTFLAVAAGAAELRKKTKERLIITRPAVEAGENLGFLPGDLEEKVEPYLRPIWDSLNEVLGADQVERMREKKIIEVAPLAFMRGRTLKNAFVIMDEAQNATVGQTKMVLTRLGRDSRMVVTGDPGQVDLPAKTPSGLAHALKILEGVEGVGFVGFTAADVRRHALVSRIIRAYDKDGEAQR
ncbi:MULTISPECIES: PhoH family protein [Henriciella]|uniref:PhoH-like protein n=1 Tax=Henriciella pelagia TaxID=1977912 RepID=A0ABQ1JJE0_9PROT|nr:PhoH family protein [Henriciella pelagia]GGB69858.1 phosphate starvation protein PhoH [Henriciella pelagia]